jgi:hypothetical protein
MEEPANETIHNRQKWEEEHEPSQPRAHHPLHESCQLVVGHFISIS